MTYRKFTLETIIATNARVYIQELVIKPTYLSNLQGARPLQVIHFIYNAV